MSLTTPFIPNIVAPWSSRNQDELINWPQHRTKELMVSTKNELAVFSPILNANFFETESDYHVHVDLPGVKKEDLQVDILTDSLIIKAERRHVHSLDTDILHRSEKTYGKVQRTIPIPKEANFSTASAIFRDGGFIIYFFFFFNS